MLASMDSLEGPSAPQRTWPKASMEVAWQSLERAVTWSVRSWWGYLTGTPGSEELATLLRKTQEQVGPDGMILLQPKTPEELVAAAKSIASSIYPPEKLIWLQPVEADKSLLLPPGDRLGRLINALSPHNRGSENADLQDVGPWMRAWSDTFSILNGYRNHMRDHRTGGLLFVGPPPIVRLARTVAIDLSSMTSISINV